MSRRRQERMAGEIQRVMSHIIMDEIKDPRINPTTVSVTRVDVSSDLSHARINISILGDDAFRNESMKILEKARGFIRAELAGAIQLKHAPEIELRLDKSIEHGIKISSLLEEIKQEDEKKDQL